METEELTKLVDGIYKNILDKFNPGARQMIIAGKAYLKALHGAAAASRMYVEAVGKLGRQAQQGTWGGSADIGTALMKVVEVYREIQDQQMNILKAFYVDLLVPLETNLEKDTKVVQSEQKRFLQQHKLRSESYSKAAATIKKQRKKTRNAAKAGSAMDKEMKSMQVLEEEKTKLDAFCEQSLKNAMTQERRRYGFVLERQCSLAKHWLAYHSAGTSAYTTGLEEWLDVARTREFLPPNVEAMFVSRMRQVSFWADEEVYASPRIGDDDDRASVGSALRKTRSVDASCLDVRSIADLGSPTQGLSRAKSDFNLQASLHSLEQDPSSETPQQRRPKSLAPGAPTTGWEAPLARALYAYHSSGDNQLSFLEGDVVALVGDRTKGWQYGENLRTHQAGWFPLAYTEMILDEHSSSPARWGSAAATPSATEAPPAPLTHAAPGAASAASTPLAGAAPPHRAHAPPRMFGDTITAHRASKTRLASSSPGLPPTLPAPVPNPAPKLTSSMSSTFASPAAPPAMKTSTSSASFITQARVETKHFPPQTLPMRGQQAVNKAIPPKGVVSAVGAVGNVSLHSSNDSGFSNEPPPQPEVDYSDEETHRNRVPISKPGQYTNEQRAYILKTQSLKRPAKTNGAPAGKTYMTDDQQIMIRTMLDMDKDNQKVKRTKSFWKFGRTTSEEIMEGMSLWQHRDIVDTVPEFKKKLYAKMHEAIQSVSETVEPRKQSIETPIPNEPPNHARETIDRKDLKTTNGMRQTKSLSSIQNGQAESRKTSNGSYEENNMKKKSMSEKSIVEEKDDDFNPTRNESRSNHSDMTNTSTIKTNFENSFYNDESGEGFVVKTVKRREILQRYDNDSSSEVNSVASSTDPYDCIIVDDHMTPRKLRDNEKRRQEQVESEIKARKEATYMPEFEEIEITPITPHVRATLSNERPKASKSSHDRTPPQRMEFKTFKDNDSEMKMFSASSETLKYKDSDQNGVDRYGSPRRENNKRKEEPYNSHDEGTLKYKKHSSKEEKVDRRRGEYEDQPKKDYPQFEVRQPKKDYQHRESEPMREPTREPVREPTREKIREQMREPTREQMREPTREQIREPTREQMREPTREQMREQMREPTREQIREPVREPMRDQVREPRKDYPSFDTREMRKEFANFESREPRKRERPNRSYDDSSLKYNGRREEKHYEANVSYFSDQERRDSKYDYDTDSKKAAKSKIRHEEHARRYMEQQINGGKYTEQSDDQKFDEAMKQQKPQLLPRTKLLKSRSQLESLEHLPMSGHTFGPWYDLWGREREAVVHKVQQFATVKLRKTLTNDRSSPAME